MYVVKFPKEIDKDRLLPAFIVEPYIVKKVNHFYITTVKDMEVIDYVPKPIDRISSDDLTE